MTDRGVERCQAICQGSVEENNFDRWSCRGGVEEWSKDKEEKLDRSISYQEAIEGPGTFSIDSPSYRGSVEIAIRKSLEAQ